MKKVHLTIAEQAALYNLQANHGDDQDTIDWAAYANYFHLNTHRGASELGEEDEEPCEECLIYGNDGFDTDARCKREVAIVAQKLDEWGIEILGFGVEPTGHTWAIKVLDDNQDLLNLLVWNAWFEACGIENKRMRGELNAYLVTPW